MRCAGNDRKEPAVVITDPARRPCEAPLLRFDVPSLLAQLEREDTWHTRTRHAVTLLEGHHGLRVVLMALHAGTVIPPHQVEGLISVQVIKGRLIFSTSSESVTIGKGQLLTLQAGIRHALEALEESAFLLTRIGGGSHPAAG